MKTTIRNCIICIHLLLTLHLSAQSCLPGGITFSTQAQIDAFPANYPGCITISGNVTIRSNPSNSITNLNGLSAVTSIGGNLYIDSNTGLTNLTGLNNLASVGSGLFIEYNSALNSLSGLNNMVSISGGMGIVENNALTSLTGLNNVSTINGGVYIAYNNALVNLVGLNGLTTINGYLDVFVNYSLVNLTGLENLTSITEYLVLIQNDNLYSLSGLNNLASIGGVLAIESHNALTSLTGLENLTSVGGAIVVTNNAALSSLSALSGITSIGGELVIYLNNALTTLVGLENINPSTINNLYLQNMGMLSVCDVPSICDYLAIPSNPATISGNAPGCATRAEVEAACLALPVELLHFSGRNQPEAIRLSWSTATETANDYFAVEHSRDGSLFREIGRVTGHGTSTTPHDYQFEHEKPAPGQHYYRLRQVDFGGAYQYSHTVSVGRESASGVALWPNPTTGLLQVAGEGTEDAAYRVYDLMGRVVLEGKLQQQIDLSGLTKGVYKVVLNTGVPATEKVVMIE